MSRRESAEKRTGWLFGAPPRETPMPRPSLGHATPVWREVLQLRGQPATTHLVTSHGRPLCDLDAAILERGGSLGEHICQACRIRASSREYGPLGAEIVR